MSRRDWGHPGVPWYAKREPRNRLACADTRAKLKAYFERQGSLYGGTRNPIAQDDDRPEPQIGCVYRDSTPEVRGDRLPPWVGRGPVDVDGATYRDIGRALGISPNRVHQIVEKALSKLREPWRGSALAEFK